MSIAANLETVAENVQKVYEAGKLATLKNSKYMNGKESGAIVTATNVTPIEHNVGVKVASRNLFDISKFVSSASGTYVNNGDGTLTVINYGTKSQNILRDVCPNLKVGDTAVVSCVHNSSKTGVYLSGAEVMWTFGKSLIITEDMLNSYITLYCARVDGVNTPATFSNIQIELGSTATEYTPYIADVAGVEVARYGKNLLSLEGRSVIDFGAADKSTKRTFPNGKGIITRLSANNTYCPTDVLDTCEVDTVNNSIRYTMQEPWAGVGLDIKLKPATAYSFDGTLVGPNVLVNLIEYAADGGWIRNSPLKSPWVATQTVTTTAETAWGIIVFIPTANDTDVEIGGDNLQLELGTTVTEYEPPQTTTYTAKADGMVEGVKSISPSMTLVPNNNAVSVECEYLKDIDLYIDNLITPVALTIEEESVNV